MAEILCIHQTHSLSPGHTAIHFPTFLAVRHGLNSGQWDVSKSDLCHCQDWLFKSLHSQSSMSFPLPAIWNRAHVGATCWRQRSNRMKGACVLESPLENSHPTGNTHIGLSWTRNTLSFYEATESSGFICWSIQCHIQPLPVYLVVSSFSLEVPENLYLEFDT